MPKRKEPELPPEKQFKGFVKTAREHEVDESGEPLERAFEKIKPATAHSPSAPSKARASRHRKNVG